MERGGAPLHSVGAPTRQASRCFPKKRVPFLVGQHDKGYKVRKEARHAADSHSQSVRANQSHEPARLQHSDLEELDEKKKLALFQVSNLYHSREGIVLTAHYYVFIEYRHTESMSLLPRGKRIKLEPANHATVTGK